MKTFCSILFSLIFFTILLQAQLLSSDKDFIEKSISTSVNFFSKNNNSVLLKDSNENSALVDSIIIDAGGCPTTYSYEYDVDNMKTSQSEHKICQCCEEIYITEYYYNENGSYTEVTIDWYPDGSEKYYQYGRSLYEYDDQNRLVVELDSMEYGVSRRHYTYNEEGNLITMIHNESENNWSEEINYTYNEFNNVTFVRLESVQPGTGRPYGWSKEYEYDDKQRILNYLYHRSASLVSDSYSIEHAYSYNEKDQLILELGKRSSLFNSETSEWKNEYHYVGDYLEEMATYSFGDDSTYFLTHIKTYLYNKKWDIIKTLESEWGYEAYKKERFTYEYNFDGNLVRGISERWSDDDWIPWAARYIGFTDSRGEVYRFWCSNFEVYYSEVTKIESDLDLNYKFKLSQNFPNPFNPSTTIKYTIPQILNTNGIKESLVQLKIYDVLGKELTTLVNKQQNPGSYEVKFNSVNYSSGVYFYKLQVGSFVETKKMILMK